MIATRELLEPLGFRLRDCGAYWQANAAFRGGDNPTAIQIYKDTGVWRDYVNGGTPLPFKLLLEKMGVTNPETYVSTVNVVKQEDEEARVKIPKLYDQSCLSRLLPHYSFYNKRGILDSTLELYRSGMAVGGKMYQRYVFPVFNESGKIQGFSGRDMSNKDRAKWKHLGQKKNWLYPFFMRDKDGKSTMDDKCVDFSKECFIIESNGDSLSMSQNGLKNHFVAFGAKLSSTLIAKLISLNPKNIFLSFNNDSDKQYAGLIGAFSAANALSDHFSKKRIHIVLPDENDFGEMKTPESYKSFLEKKNLSKGWEDIVSLAQQHKHLIDNKKVLKGIL